MFEKLPTWFMNASYEYQIAKYVIRIKKSGIRTLNKIQKGLT